MNMSTIKHFLNLWTISQYPHGSPRDEWSPDEKLAAVKAAGFDGFQEQAEPWLTSDLAGRHALDFLGMLSTNETNYATGLKKFVPLNPLRINVQLCDHDTDPAMAARAWIDLEKAAADLGLEVDLEVHRDTCTETPEKTYRIAELYAQQTGRLLRLNFDLSHFAVVKHLSPPYAPRLLDHPELIQCSRQMHLRPFNGHHCQIPVTDGQRNIAAVAQPWLEFVEAAFTYWLEGNPEGETLWVCPELGGLTSGYWIAPFPDPWQDAQVARREFEHLWQKVRQNRPPLAVQRSS